MLLPSGALHQVEPGRQPAGVVQHGRSRLRVGRGSLQEGEGVCAQDVQLHLVSADPRPPQHLRRRKRPHTQGDNSGRLQREHATHTHYPHTHKYMYMYIVFIGSEIRSTCNLRLPPNDPYLACYEPRPPPSRFCVRSEPGRWCSRRWLCPLRDACCLSAPAPEPSVLSSSPSLIPASGRSTRCTRQPSQGCV